MISEKLTQLGIELPAPAAAVGAYLPALRSGNLIFISGQLPWHAGKLAHAGKLGAELTLEEGQAAARLCLLNALAALQAEIGSLELLRRLVRLEVYVNSAPGFTQQAQVANGASNLAVDILGPPGRHARLALGAAELPLNAAVELALIAEVA